MNLQPKTSELPPFRPLPQKPPAISVRKMLDGTVDIDSSRKLGATHCQTGAWCFTTFGEA